MQRAAEEQEAAEEATRLQEALQLSQQLVRAYMDGPASSPRSQPQPAIFSPPIPYLL